MVYINQLLLKLRSCEAENNSISQGYSSFRLRTVFFIFLGSHFAASAVPKNSIQLTFLLRLCAAFFFAWLRKASQLTPMGVTSPKSRGSPSFSYSSYGSRQICWVFFPCILFGCQVELSFYSQFSVGRRSGLSGLSLANWMDGYYCCLRWSEVFSCILVATLAYRRTYGR